ncbi:MAG: ATP cone domain-containing protein [Candidatus Taylorbacteria bacterium]
MNHVITITKSDGTKELFEESKLENSLRRVGVKPEAIDEVVDEVESSMKDGMTTSEIYRKAFSLIRKHSAPVAAKYSIRRAMMELGPDGFPFEKFVARIFKMWGYETMTDQVINGACVEHEIDVVAWKDEELAMVEAKYHNEFGVKSDLKVALYVKARFDDIAGNTFEYGGKKRKLTSSWLITNTKFTDKAIKYGECNHLKLVGWNYPEKGNLHEIIEQNGLHPITCITSLTHQEKKDLVAMNVLVCIDLVGKPAILDSIGVKGEMAEKVLTEAQVIIEEAK